MNYRGWLYGIGAIVCVAVGVFAWQAFGTRTTPGEEGEPPDKATAMPPAPVVAVCVACRTLAPKQIVIGEIKPVRVSTVGSAASGRVQTFPVNEGDRVKKGDIVAQLRTATIQAEYDAAEATRKARAAELEKLEKSIDEEIKQAKARYEKSRFWQTFLKAKRERALLAGAALSREEIEQTIFEEKQATAALAEAESALIELKQTRDARLKEARAKLDAAAAEARRLADQLERHTMRAPFDGYIVQEHTEAGEWVLQGAPTVTVAELDRVHVKVSVLEDYVSYIHLGDIVEVTVPALPEGRRRFTGTIAHIVPSADPNSHTFPIKVEINNQLIQLGKKSQPLLKAEMTARVELPAGPKKTDALVVPRDCITTSTKGDAVFVVDFDKGNVGRVRAVPVRVGAADGSFVEVIGDVRPGQWVVVEGNARLRPGQPVQVTKQANEIRD